MKNLKPQTVHIHIPKCAGNSVFRSLVQAHGSKKNMMQDSIAIYKGTESIYHYKNQDEFEGNLLKTKEALLSFHLFQGFVVIGGHFIYSPRIKKKMGDKINFFTFLRDPIKRLKSHIAYLLLAHPKDDDSDDITEQNEIQDSVFKMLRSDKAKWLGMQQCLYLGGINQKGEVDLDNCLHNAMENLFDFDLVGDTENFNDFSIKFKQTYNKDFEQKSLNKIEDAARDKSLLDKVYSSFNEEALNLITDLSRKDIELYEFAIKNNLI